MRSSRKVRIASAIALLAAAQAHAQVIPITNPGFETNVVADGTFQVLFPTGWQVYDPSGIIDQGANSVGIIRPNLPTQTYYPGGAPEGQQAALVYLAGGASGAAGLQQALSATLAADTRYTLSVGIGNIASGVSLPGSADGGNFFYNLSGFPGYRIELLAGGTVLGQDSTSAGPIPEGEWRTATLVVDSTPFAAMVGQSLAVRLVNLDTPGTPAAPGIEVNFDAVSLMASPVPEPAAAGVWIAGIAMILDSSVANPFRR